LLVLKFCQLRDNGVASELGQTQVVSWNLEQWFMAKELGNIAGSNCLDRKTD